MTIPSAPAPNPAIETAFLVNQAVLFDDRDGRVHELNSSASAVWLLLDGTATLDDIATELEDILDMAPGTVRGDLDAVIVDFANKGLLAGTVPIEDGHDHHDPFHHHDHADHDHLGSGQRPNLLTVLPKPPEP